MTELLRNQRTIAHTVAISGFGYWSGEDVSVEFRPAAEDTGIVFVRRDLDPMRRIPAAVRNRVEIPRRTVLGVGGQLVEMVEHIMAAMAGLQIDNCEVWVDRPEMPGCDGSSLPFVEVLQSAGFVKQEAFRRQLVVAETVRVEEEQAWIEALPATEEGMSIKCQLDFGEAGPIGRQSYSMKVTPDRFCRELAPARTFILEQEAEWLRQQGLGQRVSCHDLLVFDERGPLDNELRFDDECIRHKALDLIGDLALVDCDIVGRIVAYRNGHRLNARLAESLLEEGWIIEGCGPGRGRRSA